MGVLDYNPRTYLSGHLKLMGAVLKRAVLDYVLYYKHEDPSRADIGQDARDWLFEDYGGPCYVFSLAEICAAMHVSTSLVRQYARGIDKAHLSKLLRGGTAYHVDSTEDADNGNEIL